MAEKRPTVIRPEKEATVREVADRLARSEIALVTDYRGLTVSQLTELRRQLSTAQAEMHVAKNTLVKLAVKGTPREVINPVLEGPTALVFGFGDAVKTAKTLSDHIRTQRLQIAIKGALLGDRLLSAADVTRFAELPSKEVLQATLVGTLSAPLAGLVGTLNGALQQLVGTLEARNEQLSGAAA